jgi:hypothetical protein
MNRQLSRFLERHFACCGGMARARAFKSIRRAWMEAEFVDMIWALNRSSLYTREQREEIVEELLLHVDPRPSVVAKFINGRGTVVDLKANTSYLHSVYSPARRFLDSGAYFGSFILGVANARDRTELFRGGYAVRLELLNYLRRYHTPRFNRKTLRLDG